MNKYVMKLIMITETYRIGFTSLTSNIFEIKANI